MNIENIKVKGKNNYNISSSLYLPSKNINRIVVACHGFGGDKESSAIKYLAETIYPKNIGLICFDFPGHGKSEVGADKLTISNCINDIDSIETYLKNRFGNEIEINIFATSFGAYITLLKIFTNKTRYNKIILRAPAIKMDEIFEKSLLRDSLDTFKKQKVTTLGFERKMVISYNFYEDLKNNKILNKYNNNQHILIIQGTDDDVAPIKDTKEFLSLDPENIELYEIIGADHRMKKKGELEKVIKKADSYLRGEKI